ncbi:MAG: ribonuclease H-like domain-containing protein [Thermodesulfobacteriota bacterium]
MKSSGIPMLKNTFCHIPGIGVVTEKRLWADGIESWERALELGSTRMTPRRRETVARCVAESKIHEEGQNPRYFADRLPARLHWRLFPEFRDRVAYVDIETTGLEPWDHSITSIALFDGKRIKTYVQGQNLEDFEHDIEDYKIIVTYNGKCFDIPFIQWYFRTRLDHVQIDLRYVLKSLGYGGGLKGCEVQLGIDRGELVGVDGFFAVLLWEDYTRSGNRKALETLLAYNVEDVVNLETLMVMAYNMKVRETPFAESLRIELPSRPEIPFKPHLATIQRLKDRIVAPGPW